MNRLNDEVALLISTVAFYRSTLRINENEFTIIFGIIAVLEVNSLAKWDWVLIRTATHGVEEKNTCLYFVFIFDLRLWWSQNFRFSSKVRMFGWYVCSNGVSFMVSAHRQDSQDTNGLIQLRLGIATEPVKPPEQERKWAKRNVFVCPVSSRCT